MAIKPSHLPRTGQQEYQAKVKRARVDIEEPQPNDPPLSPLAPQEQDAIPEMSVPSSSQLAQLLRQQKYQTRRRHRVEAHSRCIQIASAQISRQLHDARCVQRTLAECIRSEDKASFLNLFDAFRDSLTDSLNVPDAVHPDEGSTAEATSERHATFLHALSSQSKELVLDLLSKIRYDGSFIADALTSLTHKELVALLPNRSPSSAGESVFGASPWTSSRTSRHLGFVVDSQTEMLTSSAYGSSLEMLVHCVRGITGPLEYEDERTLDVWSTVCARLLSEQKPGSEKLVPAVLDIWAASAKWPGKDRLELWMLETLQNASFLTEQPSKQSFRVRVQARHDASAEDHLRAETFYTRAVNSLLDLLADQTGASVIPLPVIHMSRAIWRKLHRSPGQRGFARFVVTRWLFSPFFFDVLVLPEVSTSVQAS